MAQPRKVKTAVIGIGYLGKEHARIYRELDTCELVGVSDADASRKEIADTHGVPFYKDYRDLIGKVEAVSIATPTFTHCEIARQFLDAGIHTLIEKPITLKLSDADLLIEIAKRKNLALQVGHLERHNPGFRRICEIAKNIRFLEIHRLGPFTGRINDCGVVLDLMIHDIDIVLSIVNSEVASFDAIGINVITPYEDIANVRIKFKNGAVADMTASRLTPEKQRKIRIFQEDAYISLDYDQQKAKIFKKGLLGIGQETVDIERSEPLKEELKFFLNGILTGKSLGKPDEAARNALQFAIEIVDVIQQNQKLAKASR
jgi:predicted dehydrogenase